MKQFEEFLQGEGDNWFRRNISKMEMVTEFPDTLEIVRSFHWANPQTLNPKILEVGSGSGHRLYKLCKELSGSGFGIDPSVEAIKYANDRFSDKLEVGYLTYQVGTSDSLPFEDSHFDIVYLSFCLYLIDRDLVSITIKEACRVLRSGGLIAIRDFDVKVPVANNYIHKSGVLSFKEDYLHYFDKNAYFLISKIPFKEDGDLGFELEEDKRVALWILYKP